MMLMKAPTGGGSSTGTGRDVIFRLTVQPDPNAARITREFGEGMTRVHNMGAGVAQQRAKDISDFYRSAFDDVLRHGSSVFESLADRSRVMAGRIASDWSNAMRGIGGPGGGSVGGIGGSSGPSGFQMNMTGLAASRAPVYTPSPWPAMGGPSAWAPPPGVAGLGFGTPRWQSPVAWPSMSGSGAEAPGIGGGGGGAGGRSYTRSLEGVNNLFHGATHIARGVAYSGLVGEEDSQKMVDALLRIEGTLGLIYGAVSIGKGLGGVGAFGSLGSGAAAGGIGVAALPIAAIVAAVAAVAVVGGAAYEARNEGKTRTLPREGERPGFFARLQQNPFSDLTAGNWWTGNGEDTSDAIHRADWSFGRVKKQERFLSEDAKLRQWRMSNLASSAASAFGENDRLAEIGMRGVRSDSGKYAALGQQLTLEKEKQAKLEDEIAAAEKKGGGEAEDALRTREEISRRIFNIEEQRRDILVKGEREAADLAMNRAQHALGIAQEGLAGQGGLAKSATGRYNSDLERFGSLSPIEMMRTRSAFAAVRAGNATKEQEQIAGSYGELSDKVQSDRAKRGLAYGGDLFTAPKAQVDEFGKRMNEVIEAHHDVVYRHELTIKEAQDRGENTAAARQILDFMKEAFKAQDTETKRQLDDMRREMNAQMRNRDIIFKR